MTRAERALLDRSGEPVGFPAGATLFAPGEEIHHVFFPETGLVSLLALLPDAEPVEVALAGCEGLVGLPALLDDALAGLQAVAAVATQGLRVEAAPLRLLADGSRNLRSLLRRYTVACLAQAAQNTACVGAHPLERRMAGRLLALADRLGPHIPVTQEHLATMLGARRPTVNLVLRQLRAAGLVHQARGQLAIADRAALEAAACPCYRLARATHERLLPGAFR
jgi:CRP-like cAMP-binding protein